jgi:hypothetical protein
VSVVLLEAMGYKKMAEGGIRSFLWQARFKVRFYVLYQALEAACLVLNFLLFDLIAADANSYHKKLASKD